MAMTLASPRYGLMTLHSQGELKDSFRSMCDQLDCNLTKDMHREKLHVTTDIHRAKLHGNESRAGQSLDNLIIAFAIPCTDQTISRRTLSQRIVNREA